MAKEVTRSVLVYKHTFGKVEKGPDGAFNLTDMVEVIQPKKMGHKLASYYIKEHELPAGTSLISVETSIEKYAMPLEQFMSLAVKVQE